MPAPLRTLLADDEPLALSLLQTLVSTDPELEIVATCGNGADALRRIEAGDVDLALLDISMPALSGVEVALRTCERQRTAVVFVTAYSEHALRAFEAEAADYVVKPYSDDRLAAALRRAKRRAVERRPPMADAEAASRSRWLQRIEVRRGSRRRFVAVERIRRIESADYYSRVHLDDGTQLVRRSLTRFERELDPSRLVRTHRAAIVCLRCVRELRRDDGGSGVVRLDDGSEVPVSRSRMPRVRRALAAAARV